MDSFIEDCEKKDNSYSAMTSVKSTYLSFITPALMKHGDWESINGVRKDERLFDIKIMTLSDIILNEGVRAAGMLERRSGLAQMVENTPETKESLQISAIIDGQQRYTYPYGNESSFAVKVSVSEIKHRNAIPEKEEYEEGEKAAWISFEDSQYIPKFVRGEEEEHISGAGRGTIYHALMQYIDLERTDSREDIVNQVKELSERGILSSDVLEKNVIHINSILKFCKSDMADRMRKAGQRGALYREQPFVMGVPAEMVYPGSESVETIIVQGIIDAFFEEDGGIVLLDYKTDRLLYGEEEKLTGRYTAQMECYAMAIEKALGKPVREAVLYSFSLGKPVSVDLNTHNLRNPAN
ncbi:MAG: PD-(D/E)XK nuclease family protein, partial [Lachnospiraceae bacterium]|nr:PD-(D/E)XK nuclease family protein [Lachnospiraceae bacterium]